MVPSGMTMGPSSRGTFINHSKGAIRPTSQVPSTDMTKHGLFARLATTGSVYLTGGRSCHG